MSFESTANTMRNRFASQFHAVEPDVPIAFDNMERLYTQDGTLIQEPQDVSGNPIPWVRFSIRPGDAFQVSIGKRTWRQPGVIMVQIFTIVGSGTGDANRLADAVASSIRGVTVGGVRFQATSPPQYVGADGNWYQANAVTPFQYDEFD